MNPSDLPPVDHEMLAQLDRLLTRRAATAAATAGAAAAAATAGDASADGGSGPAVPPEPVTSSYHLFTPPHSFSGGEGAAGPAPPTTPPLPPAPAFPTAVFPRELERIIVRGATAMALAPDLVAAPLLALAGAAIGNAASIQVKRAWIERPILWTAVVAPPGSGKTPALSLARAGIEVLETEARDRHRAALEAWTAGGEKGDRPLQEDVFTSDSTMEAIAAMLTRTRGLAMIRDELAGWIASMDAYRKGGDRQTWLSLWAGVPVKVTRKTADPVFAADPVICLTGGIQPDLLPLLLGNPAVRDGLPDRLLLACPEPSPRRWTEEDLEAPLRTKLGSLFRLLRSTPGQGTPAMLEADARARFIGWYDETMSAAAAAEAGLLEGFLAKGPSQVARLALVLNCLHLPHDLAAPISAEAMEGAIAVWTYFRDHFARALALAIPARMAAAERSAPDLVVDPRVLDRVLACLTEASPAPMRRTSITQALRGMAPAGDVTAALIRLVADGRVIRVQIATSGRYAEEFRLAVPPPTAAS